MISFAYFFYDAFFCVVIKDGESLLHHLATLSGLATGLYLQRGGTELVIGLAVTEVTTPLLHTRSLLKWRIKELRQLREESKESEVIVAKIEGAEWWLSKVTLLFGYIFLLSRMIVGAWLTYSTLVCATSPVLIKVGSVGIMGVSAFWAVRIVRIGFFGFRE
eukprot:GHVN01033921.1.p1 GENE.GHVN01033921.1~~GHVN01033921.1.p1  ORF type:complete len:162 (+),score=25.14 GHVN01033921.1:34-519(+)